MKLRKLIMSVVMMAAGAVLLVACFGKSQGLNEVGETAPGSVSLASPEQSSEFPYSLGVGKVEITPTGDPLPSLMGGAVSKPADSVKLPLFVKAAVISAGGQKVAMVTIDILKYPNDKTDLAAKEIEAATGIPAANVTITASHTHSGPLHHYYIDMLSGKDRLIKSIIQAIEMANQNMTPVKLGVAAIEVTGMSHNRRLLLDGEVWNDWMNIPDTDGEPLRAAGAIDPELVSLAAIGPDGKYKAILWNFACHPSTEMINNQISSDYPGHFQNFINQKLGYETMTLFFAGPSGDINPEPRPEYVGESLADKMLESLTNMRMVTEATLTVERRVIQIPGRDNPDFTEEEKELSIKWPDVIESYRESFRNMKISARDKYDVNMTGIRIGNDFAIVSSPDELFVAYGLEIKDESPFGVTMVIQQTNGAHGYIPTLKDFELKGYETWFGEHSYLSVDAGEMIRDESVNILKSLR